MIVPMLTCPLMQLFNLNTATFFRSDNATIVRTTRQLEMLYNEEGIKEVKKKEGFRSTTVRLPTLFVRSRETLLAMAGLPRHSTLCLPIKSFFYYFSFNLNVISSRTFAMKHSFSICCELISFNTT